jgi:hypothetical protein
MFFVLLYSILSLDCVIRSVLTYVPYLLSLFIENPLFSFQDKQIKLSLRQIFQISKILTLCEKKHINPTAVACKHVLRIYTLLMPIYSLLS